MSNPDFLPQQPTQKPTSVSELAVPEEQVALEVKGNGAVPEPEPPVIFTHLKSEVNAIAISPDGRWLIAGLSDAGIAFAKSSPTLQPEPTLQVNRSTLQLFDLVNSTPSAQSFQEHRAHVRSVAFSPDGQTIVSGDLKGRVCRWKRDGTLIEDIFPYQGASGHGDVYSVAFSPPDGQTIAISIEDGGDGIVYLWRPGSKSISFRGQATHANSVAFSPDGQIIVTGNWDGTIRLWSRDGIPISHQSLRHQDSVSSVAFSPDGKTIVSGGGSDRGREKTTIRLWSHDGTPVGPPFPYQASVNSVAFSPDGQTIVSGSEDETVRLWSLDGKQIGQPFQHQGDVTSVAFSPDGQTIVSGSNDKTIRLWSLDGTPLRNLAARSRRIPVPQGIANDLAQGDDQLDVKDELDALATVLMLRSLQPPVAVGILGSWGSGKSFGMYLIQQQVNQIRSQFLTSIQAWGYPSDPDTSQRSPYVGHVYQIQFNAWTYAKSNLWASLMQEIFYELNHQISLEQQLARFLANIPESTVSPPTESAPESSKTQPLPSLTYLDQFIYRPLFNLYQDSRHTAQDLFRQIAKLGARLLRILDLWLIQPCLHISLFVLIVLLIALFSSLNWLKQISKRFIGRKIDLATKLSDALKPFNWSGKQFSLYYFPNWDLFARSQRDSRQIRWVESVAEDTLFLLFVGFPNRLKDRQKFWMQEFVKWGIDQPIAPKSSNSTEPSPPETLDIRASQVLREGGEVWQVLSLTSEEERYAFLQQELKPDDKFQAWKNQTTAPDNTNFLWTALDQVKQAEQDRLKTTEKELQKKEEALQSQLKSAEVEVNRRLLRRVGATLWKPLVNGLARLRFSKQEIEDLAAKRQTFTLLRQTITSWQGLLALFLMGIFIVLTTYPHGWKTAITLLQQFLADTGLGTQISLLIPDWLKAIPTWANSTLLWLRINLPIWVQIGTAALVALIPAVTALGNYITAVQKEQARIQSERDGLLKKAQGNTEGLAKQVAQLKLQVEQQRQRLGLTANYASLLDFVNDRLAGDDYGQHLGLMQQVKQDLAALSDRLTEGTRNREELQKLFPRGPARVILYIDDLDRCPPNRVVEVLEAVQLLLNTKLFIVVLGIDDRYIARALEEVYRRVLKRGGKPSGIDYLEKIIQIPYRMRPISPKMVETYLNAQLQVRKDPEQDATQPNPEVFTQQTPAPISRSGKSELSPQESQTAETDSAATEFDNAKAQSSESPPTEPVKTDAQSAASEAVTSKYLETIAQVTELDDIEFKILVNCCQRVDITPRTAKRLINIYKILQIIWSTRKQKLEAPDKRLVMSFLALSGRYPNFMRNLFEELDILLEEKSLEDSQNSDLENPQVAIALDTLLKIIQPQFPDSDVNTKREWRRFTSDIQQMLRDSKLPKDSVIELQIDLKTFELMLSFCFVGDIGYDPDDHHDQQERATAKTDPFPISEGLE